MTAPLDISALLPVDGTTVMNAASVAGPMNKIVAAYDSHVTNAAVAGYGPDNHKADAILPFAALPLTTVRQYTPNTQHSANDMFAVAWLDAVTGTRANWDSVAVTTPLNTLAATVNAFTSANTAGAGVKRDGSGNFSAGTITASLNGNATGITGVTAGGLLVGAGAGAMTTLAAGTNLFVLTSNGPGVAPSWQAGGGGGSGTSADTGLYATQGTNDVALSHMLNGTVWGPLIGAIQNGTSAGTLKLAVGSGSVPIVVEVNGFRQEANSAHQPVSNSISGNAAGLQQVIADVSAVAGNFLGTGSLVVNAQGTALSASQVLLATVYWDGAAFQLSAPHGMFYNTQALLNGYSFQKIGMFVTPVVVGTPLSLSVDNAITAIGSVNTIYSASPFQVKMRARWHAKVLAPAVITATNDTRIYLMYSTGTGVTPVAYIAGYTQFVGLVANQVVTAYGQAEVAGLGPGPINFQLAYFKLDSGHTYSINEANLDVELVR